MPTIPPTPWHGNTSSVSSIEVRVRHSTTRLLTNAEIIPIASECGTDTYPAAGVIATSPTTAPMQVPMAEGFLPRNISKNIQVKPAAADAVVLVARAVTARRLAPNAEPALNPNHPNHKRPVPIITSVIRAGAW